MESPRVESGVAGVAGASLVGTDDSSRHDTRDAARDAGPLDELSALSGTGDLGRSAYSAHSSGELVSASVASSGRSGSESKLS